MHWDDLTIRQLIAVALAALCTAWLCVSLWWSARTWRIATRLYGHAPFAMAFQMLLWVRRTKNVGRILLAITMFAVGFLSVWFADLQPAVLGVVLLLPGALLIPVAVLDLVEPPSVLLLGSSQWQTVRVAARIHLYIYPYRLIYLLDANAATNARTSWIAHEQFKIDNLRILGEHNWQEVVFPLSERVPIIVLDTRIPSPAVLHEAQRIVGSNLKEKTVFLTHEDGSSPALAAIDEDIDESGVLTATTHSIAHVLRGLGLIHTASPVDHPGYFLISNRNVEKCMTRIFQCGDDYSAALTRAFNRSGETLFISDARKLLEQLNGPPGAGLADVAAGLDDDIEAVESFLDRWEDEEDLEHQPVVSEAKRTCQRLAELQVAFDAASVDFVAENTNLLRNPLPSRK